MSGDAGNKKPGGDAQSLSEAYDRQRQLLQDLWSAPVRDMLAIQEAMVRLDEVHAAFKATHASIGNDHQRY